MQKQTRNFCACLEKIASLPTKTLLVSKYQSHLQQYGFSKRICICLEQGHAFLRTFFKLKCLLKLMKLLIKDSTMTILVNVAHRLHDYPSNWTFTLFSCPYVRETYMWVNCFFHECYESQHDFVYWFVRKLWHKPYSSCCQRQWSLQRIRDSY